MRYDLHIHTERSPCSDMKLPEIVRIAKKRGLDGIAITDHDILPKIEGAYDIDIIPGIEITTEDGGHVLAYYIKKPVKSKRFEDIIDELKKQDCIIALAHPRDILRQHFTDEQIDDKRVDAIEAVNGRTLLSGKIRSSKPRIGGSDSHFYNEIGKAYTEFEGSLRQAIKDDKTRAFGNSRFTTINSARSVIRRFVHR